MRTLKISIAAVLALLMCSFTVTSALAADPPHLLKDLRPGDIWNPFAEHFTTVGDRVFFDADDGVHGRELYVSDGTADGTFMVKDINPGSGSGLRFHNGLVDVNALTAVGDRLFFIARDGVSGAGLYVTDGTSEGTQRLAHRRECDGASQRMLAVGSNVVFASKNAVGKCRIFASDGTAAGTRAISRAVPSFRKPVLFNNEVFFLGRNDDYGTTLWKNSMLPGGRATMVYSFYGFTEQLVASGPNLYLNPSTLLWKTDGTTAGTKIVAPKLRLNANWLSDVDGRLVFVSNYSSKYGPSIWRTRGTTETTRMLKELGPDGGSINWGGHATDHHAYFNTAYEGLWASDGTSAGTQRVGDMTALWSTSLGDQLYFSGSEGTSQYPVFTSDGTAAGTHRIDGPVNTVQLGAAGNTVFIAENGELWVYNP